MMNLNELDGKLRSQSSKRAKSRFQEANLNDIAIIGIAVKLPLADTVNEFWNNVRTAKNCVRPFPPGRRESIERYLDFIGADKQGRHFRDMSYLETLDQFDYQFFQLSPREASLINPEQRLFLQTSWSAIEDAGYGGKALVGSRTGVFVGFMGEAAGSRYSKMILDTNEDRFNMSIPGNLAAILPSRLSYLLDLKGPTMSIDTACSSSLVAVHQACRAIQNGDCEMAVVGGVRTDLIPIELEREKIGIESSDSYTRTYDDNADGSGLGEGVAAVVLKPLGDALRDGDSVYAVIKGSAINQDGSSISITAPNAIAQADVITRAWKNAGVDPETIGYIEAHGTGTRLGDVVEIEGLQRAFKPFTDKKQFCALGSVKTNIGHLYQSAGIVGLIKAALALHHQELPPSIPFQKPNRKFSLVDSPVYFNTKLRKWERGEFPRRAGVSSFGLSGTNSHVVLEETPEQPRTDVEAANAQVFTLSAHREAVLRDLVEHYCEYLAKNQDVRLTDLCYTAGVGRGHYGHRLALIVTSTQELLDKLTQLRESAFDQVADDVYYSETRIVPNDKQSRATGELTAQEVQELTEAAQAFVAARNVGLFERNDLRELSSFYIKGAELEWAALYRGLSTKRLHVPTYPFARESCWIEIPELRHAIKQYYTLSWSEDEQVQRPAKTVEHGLSLVFKDARGIGAVIAQQLRASGRDVVEVEFGTVTQKLSDTHFIVGQSEAAYDELLQLLPRQDITDVLHLMAMGETNDIDTIEALAVSQQRGVYSLFYLTRAILRLNIRNPIEMVLVADYVAEVRGDEPRMHPQHASLFGLGKVIGQEHPEITCRAIDIEDGMEAGDLLDVILQGDELYHVAYRNGKRHSMTFHEVELAEVEEREIVLQSEGVYLITGGLGGMGLEVAKDLIAQQSPIKLALLNRQPLPDRAVWNDLPEDWNTAKVRKAIERIRLLESLGAEVAYYSADVADLEAMRVVIEELKAKYGRINGIVHCAGVAGNGFLIRKDEATFDSVLNPKIYGTWILDQLTAEDEMDFVIYFASGAALIGEPGQSDYTAGNGFQEAYSLYRNKRGKNTLAINWVVWKEVGMGVDNGFAREGIVFKLLPTDQALVAFNELKGRELKTIFVGELNLESEELFIFDNARFHISEPIRKQIDGVRQKGRGETQTKQIVQNTAPVGDVELIGKDSGEYTTTELKIAEVCRNVLGFQRINVYDSFFELGADSLLIKKMHGELDQKFPGQLNVADMFSHTSVLKLASHIDGEQVVVVDDETLELEKLLNDLESGSLSIDDAIKNLQGK